MTDIFPKRILRKNVLEALDNYGALMFNKDIWYDRCVSYNVALANEINYM